MTAPGAMTAAPRCGVLRLVVLALTLAGFVAMHGLAAADAGEAHCGLPALLLTSDAGPTIDQPAAHHSSGIADTHGSNA